MTKWLKFVVASWLLLPYCAAFGAGMSGYVVNTPLLSDTVIGVHNYTGQNTGATSQFTVGALLSTPGSTQYMPFSGGTFTNNITLGYITGLTQCLQVNSTGLVSGTGAACGSGSGGTPGGSNGSIQFNNSSAFGGYTLGYGLGTASGALYAPGSLVINTAAPPYNVVCNGTTDNASAINTAIIAAYNAGGGEVQLPSGTCAVGSTVTMYSFVTLKGSGWGATTLKALASMSGTTDLIQSYDFSTLNGTDNYASAPYLFTIKDMTIDGNKANRSGTGGNDISLYAYTVKLERLNVWNSPGIGIYSFCPHFSNYNLDDYWNEVKVQSAHADGVDFYGPSDSVINNSIADLNGGAGFVFSDNKTYANAGGTWLHNDHAWQNASWGFVIDAFIQGTGIESETNTGGGGIEIPTTSGDGALVASSVYAWGNTGPGIEISNTENSFTHTGTTLSSVQTYSNTGDGIWVNIGQNTTGPGVMLAAVQTTYNGGSGLRMGPNPYNIGGDKGQIDGLVSQYNTGAGMILNMQDVTITNMFIQYNGADGINASANTGALLLDTLIGNVQGNTGTQIAFPASGMGAGNNIQIVTYTASGQTEYTGGLVLTNNQISLYGIGADARLVNSTFAGVTCSGTPTSSFATTNGVVTHC